MREARPTSTTQFLALAEYVRRRADGLPIDPSAGLGPYELKVFSQNGEDGVLGEILRRAGVTTPGFFVEFGAEDGVEMNCALLADVFGWSGVLLEGDPEKHGRLHRKYGPNPRVVTRQAMVEPGSIQAVLEELGTPAEFDVLSIDVDGDDYWIWQSITSLSPKVVVIEFNGHIDPHTVAVQPEGGDPWRGTDFYGSSAGALRALGESKGYRFVHADLTTNNLFFVRNDVPGDYPAEPLLMGPNHYLLGLAHPVDETGRQYVDPR